MKHDQGPDSSSKPYRRHEVATIGAQLGWSSVAPVGLSL